MVEIGVVREQGNARLELNVARYVVSMNQDQQWAKNDVTDSLYADKMVKNNTNLTNSWKYKEKWVT